LYFPIALALVIGKFNELALDTGASFMVKWKVYHENISGRLCAPKLYHGRGWLSIGVCPYVVFLQMWLVGAFWLYNKPMFNDTGKQKMSKIKRVAIYDMDGTIVDSSHRYRTIIDESGERIDLQYWRDNEYRAMDDKLLPMFDQYKSDLADPECYVIIATARVMHEPDWKFVNEVLGMPDYFISRVEGSAISGKQLKINGLAKFFNLVNFKDADFVFYEDNIQYLKAVCDRFKIRGVYVPSVQGH
jgi:hypothetical protein